MAMKYGGGSSYRIMLFCLPKQYFQYSMCVSIFLEEQDVITNSSVTQIHLLSLNLLMNCCNFSQISIVTSKEKENRFVLNIVF